MRTFSLFIALLLSFHANGQLSTQHAVGSAPQGRPVSKAEYEAAKNRGTQNLRAPQTSVLDYGGVDEAAVTDSGGSYGRYIWDLNTNYVETDPNRFALTWGVVLFDTIYDLNTMTPYPRSSTSVKIDSIRTYITHENLTHTPDTILISVYQWQGAVGIVVDAQEEITNTVLWDTMIITTNSLTPDLSTLGYITARPRITLTYPNNRYAVGVHFYGDTTYSTFNVLAGYPDRCAGFCQASASVFPLHSLYRIIAWSGGNNLTGINSLAYDCNGNQVAGEPQFCEEFPIQDLGIVSYVTINPTLTASVTTPVSKCPNQPAQLNVTASSGTQPYTYHWSPSTGLSSTTIANPTTNVNSSTTYTVTVSDAAGGSVTKTVAVQLNGITVTAGNDVQIGCGQTTNLLAVASGLAPSYLWSNGVTTATNSFVGAGTYTVTATNSFGCTASDAVVVSVTNVNQQVNFSAVGAPNNTTCRDSVINFINQSTHKTFWNFTWSFGDGDLAFNENATHAYSIPGIYTVTLTADSGGCTFTSTSQQFTINACGSSCPDPGITSVGYHPAPSAWACVQRGVPYFQTVQINIPTTFDTVVLGNLFTVTVNSFTLDSIPGLPSGITYSCSPCSASGGGTICLTLSGTTNDPIGQYPLRLSSSITMTIPIIGQTTGTADLDQIMRDSSYLNVINNGAPCTATQLSVSISANPTGAICSGQSVTLTANVTGSTGAVSYLWSTLASTQSINVQPNSSSTISVMVNDANGSATASYTLTVNPTTTASFNYNVSGTSVTFTDNSTNSPFTWSWTFGDGGTSSQQSPSHTYAGTGTYNVCLTATNNCGSNQLCQNVVVSGGCSNPVAAYGSSASGTTVNFTDNSSNTPTSWSWNFGDGGTSTQRNPSHTYSSAGTYNVCLTATNSCGSNQKCQNITVTTGCTAPVASFTNNSSGTTAMFTDNSTNTPTSWSWTFGDGGTSTQQNPSHTYSSAGTYNVCLTATNGCGNNQSCHNVTVTSGCNSPVASFSNSATGTTAAFTDNSTNTPTSWSWTFGDGGTSTQQNPSHTYSSAGTYNVCLTATNGCGNNQSCHNVTITSGCSSPVASFSNSATGTTATFTDNSTNTPTSWSWTFGDGGTSTQQNPSHTYSSAGTYTVCLTATNGCGNNQSCHSVTVTSGCNSPVASFSNTASGTTATFTDNSTNSPNAWSWTFGDGGSSSQQNPSHTYTNAGSYSVCLTATNSCGNHTSCQTITVTCNAPAASYSYNASNTTVAFTDNSTNSPTAWSWTFGDGGSSTQQNPSHTYTTAGSYSVCLTATNGCSNNTSCQTITVTCNAPTAAYNYNASGLTVAFTESSTNSPTAWSWTFGDGGSSTQQNPSHTFTAAGSYSVCLTATNSCGNNTSCQTISVTCTTLPAASFSHSESGTTVSFTDNSTNSPSSWSWTFGDGGSSTQQNPSHTYATAGSYSVCLTATNSCGNNSSCQTITVTCNAAPAASFSYTPATTTVSFTDNSTNSPSSWSWTFGDGGSSTQQNPSHTYATAGSYSVCLTATNSCGNNSSCQTITVTCNAAPAASFSYTPATTTVSFTDNSTNSPSSWSWTFGDGGSSTQQNPSHTYATAGSYSVCLTATNSCGNNSSCQTITVTCNAAPAASFSYTPDTTTVSFTDNSTNSPSSWSWTFGDGGSSNQQNPSHTYSNAGSYTVCLDASNSCGSDNSCETIALTVGTTDIYPTSTLKIYPNPFTEITTIEIPEEVKGLYDLRIVDLIGRNAKVLNHLSDRMLHLNRESLADGIYFIEVRAEKSYFGKVMLK